MNELLTVNVRYKEPDKDVSKLISKALKDKKTDPEKVTENFNFSAAAAEFAMLLRDSKYKAKSSYDNVIKLAKEGKGEDKNGYRAEFLRLVGLAKDIAK